MKSNNAIKLGAWVALLIVGMGLGLYAFGEMLTRGQGETLGTTQQVPWGIFIVGYAFFIGISAGATFIGLMIHAFKRDDYSPLGIPALLVAILSLVAAMSFIVLDAGNMTRMILVPWVLRNPSSVFVYTASTYFLFTLILIGQLYYTLKLARGSSSDSDRKMGKWLAVAAVPVAFWLQGALFGAVKARELWNSPLLPPHSMVAALVSGTAVLILVALITSIVTRRPIVRKQTLAHMGKLLAFFLAATLIFDLVDIFVVSYSETVEGAETWALLMGKFHVLHVVNLGGLVLALAILLFHRGRAANGLFVASLVSLLAMAAYRYNLVIVGQSVPLWHDQVGVVAEYSPSSVEWSLVVGIVAMNLLAYTVLVRILRAKELGSDEGQALSTARLSV